MKPLLALALFLFGCSSLAEPPIVSAIATDADGQVVAFVRSNLRQTVAQGALAFDVGIILTNGVPVAQRTLGGGKLLWIDRDADVQMELNPGSPLPIAAAVLFPDGADVALGITYSPDPPD